ncbi:DEKNAAC102754 [Brettanomyces naardenensis]|uniref:DEKNAAC102754 n=1 Tax=Brettanomyces naardenensis TaxID=13370 RepID=A0A448YKA9_BRENA|nr:DEKNAAC102754 [Brettanomyces naardenensis]
MATVYKSELDIPAKSSFSLKDKSLKLDNLEQVQPYLDELSSKKDLQKIDLSGNTISPEASKYLASGILKHKDTLEELNLQDIYTSRDKNEIPASLTEFFAVIERLPHLRVLNLSDNAFGQDTIEVLEGFVSKSKYIEHLIISNNGLGPFSGARLGKALYRMAKLRDASEEKDKNVRSLKTFWCGRNRLESGSSELLALGLRANKNLKEIRLYQNGIRPNGIARLIFHGLSHLHDLEVLDLDDNTFTWPGSVALADSLSKWPELKELNVNDCLLKARGCVKLLEKLAEFSDKSKLETLKMQYNELDDSSLKLLVALLPNLKNHSILELNGNRFEEDSEYVDRINSIFAIKGTGSLDELDDLEELDSEDEEEEEGEDGEDGDESEQEEDEEERKKVEDKLATLEKDLAETHI